MSTSRCSKRGVAPTDTQTHIADFPQKSHFPSFLPSFRLFILPPVSPILEPANDCLSPWFLIYRSVTTTDNSIDRPVTGGVARTARLRRPVTAQDKWNCVTSLSAVNISTASATIRSLDRVRRRRDGGWSGQRAVSSGRESRRRHRISDKHFVVPGGASLEPQMRRKWAQNDAQLCGSTTFASLRVGLVLRTRQPIRSSRRRRSATRFSSISQHPCLNIFHVFDSVHNFRFNLITSRSSFVSLSFIVT